MKHTHLFLPVFAALLTAAAPAFGSVLGLPSGPYVTTWDTFTGINTAGQTPTTASADYSAAALHTTMTAGSVTGSGQRIYSGSGASGNPFSFNVTGNTAINLTDLTFVLKFTPALQSGPSAADVTHFNVTLNGAATSAPTLLGTSVEGTNNFQIYAWTWTGVNLTPGGAFTFAATSGGGHVSLDAIQIVPEPSAAALGALAGAMSLARRRRS